METPTIPCSIYNNQTQIELDNQWLNNLPTWVQQHALPHASQHQLAASVLNELPFLEISFINDQDIAQAHADFMDDPTPTDVITFLHGELLISVETGQKQAKEHQQELKIELLRYIIHGLLHLAGHTDYKQTDQDIMLKIQESILEKIHSQLL